MVSLLEITSSQPLTAAKGFGLSKVRTSTFIQNIVGAFGRSHAPGFPQSFRWCLHVFACCSEDVRQLSQRYSVILQPMASLLHVSQ